ALGKFKTVKKGYCTFRFGSAIIIARAREVCGVAGWSWQWRLALFGSRPAWNGCLLVLSVPGLPLFWREPIAFCSNSFPVTGYAPAHTGNITPRNTADRARAAHSPPAAAAARSSGNRRCWHHATTAPPSVESPETH